MANPGTAAMHVLIIDDHPLFRAGFATTLERLPAPVEMLGCESCEDALEIISTHPEISLILLDLTLAGMDGIKGLSLLREALPATPVVVVSASEDLDKIHLCIEQGAKGYIPKSADSAIILSAINLVMAGSVYLPPTIVHQRGFNEETVDQADAGTLTPREKEVLLCLSQGMSNKRIAELLEMAENTVRVHVASILKRLNVHNRTEAGYKAVRLGLVSD
jgi:DNA-binding NarL/FixJ family response regulator